MAVTAAGATDVGRRRDENEDRFHVDVDRGVFIVVDGIGGHAAGDTAAETAILAMRERMSRQTGTVPDRLREAITIANNEIHRLASTRPEWEGMACVLTAAVVDGRRTVIGHVGDSRLYLLQGQQIEKITPDHSPVGEREDAKELSELEAMRHPRRNEVYRDVGSEHHAMDDPDFVFLAEIDFPPDAALLLCSDGLTDLVASETIRRIATSRAGSPANVVRGLIDAANEAGGTDNVTAVFIEGPAFASGTKSRRSDRGSRPLREWVLPTAVASVTFAALLLGSSFDSSHWLGGGAASVLGSSSGAIVVRSGESIMAAIDQASPGTDVIVEPGEYRERLTLKDNVRVLSRVPRGAVLRLPGAAGERDSAVLAAGVANAELAGFRIVGDSATPLGVGVLTRDGTVRLVDLEISGAIIAALDVAGAGAGGVSLIGSTIHDNAGSALIIRTGAPRLSHNVFERNATSERAVAAFVIERDAHPQWSRNVFQDLGPEALAGADELMRASLTRDNWFLGVRPAPAVSPPAVPPPAVPPPGGRSGRGR